MSICSSQSWAVGLLKTICAMKLQNDADWDLARPESVCVDVKSTGGRSQAGPDSPSYQPGGICRRFTWGVCVWGRVFHLKGRVSLRLILSTS